jgi:DNA-binding beta-propeller fold protein YncE
MWQSFSWPSGRRLRCGGLFALGLFALATVARAAAPTDLVTGLTGGIGAALDATQGHLYFVDFGAGTLKRVHLAPDCVATPPVSACTVDEVASGFVHPESVAIDAAAGFGYVTTRDDPGTTGALWRVELATGTRSLVTFNLGAPQQVVVDPPTHAVYTVGFDNGRLWRIDLATGARVALVQGLGHPVGLAVSADRTRGYVSEQDTGRVAEYELDTGARLRVVATGLTAPFFLAWSDPAQLSLYLTERDPANRLSRIDLVTSTVVPLAIDPPGLPFRPSGVAFDLFAGAAYVTADAKLVRIGLAGLPLGEPVFLGVGNVPSTSITDGYATTNPGYYFPVRDAPFGGTLNLFGNLQHFGHDLGATHYRVKVSKDGAPAVSATPSWTTYRWNVTDEEYQPVEVAPVAGTDLYEIPVEYGGPSPQPQRFYPPFLMLRWPSSENGLYTFQVEIVRPAVPGPGWVDLTSLLPPAKNSLTLLIDNTAPEVDLVSVRQAGAPIPVCAIVNAGLNQFDFLVTAHDPNHHLASYSLSAYWGKNGSEPIYADGYGAHVDAEGPRLWSGVTNFAVPPVPWEAHCRCAHTFFLDAWKRTTDGYGPVLYGASHQSLTINLGILPACP